MRGYKECYLFLYLKEVDAFFVVETETWFEDWHSRVERYEITSKSWHLAVEDVVGNSASPREEVRFHSLLIFDSIECLLCLSNTPVYRRQEIQQEPPPARRRWQPRGHVGRKSPQPFTSVTTSTIMPLHTARRTHATKPHPTMTTTRPKRHRPKATRRKTTGRRPATQPLR